MNKTALLLATASLCAAFVFNEWNVALIRRTYPQARLCASNDASCANTRSLVYDQTVYCIDNGCYLLPVQNFLAGRGWRDNPGVGKGSYLRRTPGYSILYYFFVRPFGFAAGHRALKYFQCLLFAASAYVFILTLSELGAGGWAAIGLSSLYGLAPFFYGWLYFTLTEAITPSLMVGYVFCSVKALHSQAGDAKLRYYLLASFLIGVLTLTRPYTPIAGLILAVFLAHDYYFSTPNRDLQAFTRKTVLVALTPLTMIGAWTMRNYLLTGEVVPLEVAVHPESLDFMKPEHVGMFRFTEAWGEDSSEFLRYHAPFYSAALRGDAGDNHVSDLLKMWPREIVAEFGYPRLFDVVKSHQSVLLEEKPYFDKQIAMPSAYLPDELRVKAMYDQLISEYARAHSFRYWIGTPMMHLRRMIMHSGTSHLYCLQKDRRIRAVDVFRTALVLVHVSIYAGLLVNLVLMKEGPEKVAFGYVPLLFALFFTVIFRQVEQRYMLPILPAMIAGLAFVPESLARLRGFWLQRP